MKIISKFHDYYDSARAYGEDPNIIYVRKTEEIAEKGIIKFNSYKENFFNMGTDTNSWYTKSVYVAFCGKIYPVMLINKWSLNHENVWYKAAYSIKDIDKIPSLRKLLINGTEEYMSKQYHIIKNYFKNFNNDSIGLDIFFKYNVPYFVIEKDKVILNPILKNYYFQKIFDSFSAHQRIAEFVGGVLSRCEIPKPVDDKYLIKQKGFNDLSFRRQKHPRKSR